MIRGPARRRGEKTASTVAGPLALWAVLFVVVVLSGCRTAPPAPPSTLSQYLPEGAASYIYLDVPKAQEPTRRILSSAGVEDRALRRILARTERVAAAVGGERPGEFSVAASGRFRGFFLQAMLDEQDGWTRRTVELDDRRYGVWTRDADGIEIAFPDSRIVMLASGEIEERLGAGPEARAPGANRADEHAAVVVVPRTEVAAPFGNIRVAVHDIEVRADPVDADRVGTDSDAAEKRTWRIGGALRLEREGTARAFTALIRVLTVSMIRDTGADSGEAVKVLSVEREGTRIFVEGIVLAERYVLRALDQFLLDTDSEGR